MIDKKIFDEYGKKQLREILEKGEKPTIIAGFIDYFGDGELALCSNCATPVLVKPRLLDAIDQHDLQVLCICCVEDTQTLRGQMIIDMAKIEKMAEDHIKQSGEKSNGEPLLEHR